MKKNIIFLTILLSVFCCNREPCGIRTPPTDVAVYEMSDKFSIPSSLLKGIRWAESANGTLTNNGWVWSDSYRVVIQEDWVKNFPHRKQLERRYGRSLYYCVGDFQILYLVARLNGYTNSPYQLGNDVRMNCYFASKTLRYYLDRYDGNIKRAISAYNAGHVVYDSDGNFANQRYVNTVWKVYTNLMAGGYKE